MKEQKPLKRVPLQFFTYAGAYSLIERYPDVWSHVEIDATTGEAPYKVHAR